MIIRSAEELVAGILQRIPDSADAKASLKYKLEGVLEHARLHRDPRPRVAAPEIYLDENRKILIVICRECDGDLARVSDCDWKDAVIRYINTGT